MIKEGIKIEDFLPILTGAISQILSQEYINKIALSEGWQEYIYEEKIIEEQIDRGDGNMVPTTKLVTEKKENPINKEMFLANFFIKTLLETGKNSVMKYNISIANKELEQDISKIL